MESRRDDTWKVAEMICDAHEESECEGEEAPEEDRPLETCRVVVVAEGVGGAHEDETGEAVGDANEHGAWRGEGRVEGRGRSRARLGDGARVRAIG